MNLRSSCLLLLGLASCITCFAQQRQVSSQPSQFAPFKGEGYYWYQQDPEEDPPPKIEPPKPLAPAPAPKASEPPPKALSVAWLKINLPRLLEVATDHPTPENVANYMYAQRILLDKSQAVADASKEVVAADPFLDENNRFPVAQYAQLDFLRTAKKGQDSVLAHLGKTSGIWVFVDTPDKCSACEDYVKNVLLGYKGSPGIATQFGFNFRKIYINTPEGKVAAKKLNLKVAPTTVLVMPPSEYFLVSQGLMGQSTLSDRLLLAGKMSGTLPSEMLALVNPYSKGVLTSEEINADLKGQEPSDVMKNLRERIKGKLR